jgi:hypothetical protein
MDAGQSFGGRRGGQLPTGQAGHEQQQLQRDDNAALAVGHKAANLGKKRANFNHR